MLLRIENVLEAPPEHVVDLLEAGRHRPRPDRIPLVMEEQIHEVQDRKDADHLSVAADDGNRPQVGPLHPLIGLVKRIPERGRNDLPTADILGRRPDIHDDPRRRHPGPVEDIFSSLVGRAATGRHGVRTGRLLEEIGIGDRRTDRIGVGIPMPEDENTHGGIAG